jgi:hypothetical protein
VDCRVFIQTNNNQLLPAQIAKFAIETRGHARRHGIPVTIMNVDEMPLFKAFAGVAYRSGAEVMTYDRNRLQSFTLSRFMPPELMGYSGRAVVIDPDVLALADINELFAIDLKEHAIAACRRSIGWETSVMLLDCARLTHWTIADILSGLKNQAIDYVELMWLRTETSVLELPDVWNTHDKIEPGTRMLHMTRILTQPWKTGLPIASTYGKPKAVLGVIPREPLRRLLGRPVARFRSHPEADVESAFMTLFKEALDTGAVTKAAVAEAVAHKFIRPDIWQHIA